MTSPLGTAGATMRPGSALHQPSTFLPEVPASALPAAASAAAKAAAAAVDGGISGWPAGVLTAREGDLVTTILNWMAPTSMLSSNYLTQQLCSGRESPAVHLHAGCSAAGSLAHQCCARCPPPPAPCPPRRSRSPAAWMRCRVFSASLLTSKASHRARACRHSCLVPCWHGTML